MKRKTILLRTLSLIILLMVSIGISVMPVMAADCAYDCLWEESCLVNPYTLGCKQYFGTEIFDPYQQIWYCVKNCSNPCSTNCFK